MTAPAESDLDRALEHGFGVLYKVISVLAGIVTFFGCWAYAMTTYGWFLGGALGWIPAIFFAALAALLWPIPALIALVVWLKK